MQENFLWFHGYSDRGLKGTGCESEMLFVYKEGDWKNMDSLFNDNCCV